MSQVKDIAVKCFRDEAQAILDLIPVDEHFDAAVDLMLRCTGKVIITGVGKAGIRCQDGRYVGEYGDTGFFINPLDVFHGDLGVMTPDDVVIAISNSGQTDELSSFHTLFIGTSYSFDWHFRKSRFFCWAKYSTCHLVVKVSHEACPLNWAPTSSTTATLAMGDALACALIEMRHFQAKDFAQFHPGGTLGKLLPLRMMMRSNDLPVIPPE